MLPETSQETPRDSAGPQYGSDRDGLIWGYAFSPGKPPQPVDSAAPAALSGAAAPAVSAPPGTFYWLHFALSNAASQRWIQANLGLPDSFHDSLQQEAGSTKLEQESNSLVAVIHDILFDFTFDPAGVSTVVLCIEPRLLVSMRLKPLRSIDRLRAAVKGGQQFRSTAELLSHLLLDQVDVLVDIVRQSTARVNQIEDKLLSPHRTSTSRRELGSLRRVLVRLQRLLAPEPAALFRLLNRPPAWISGEDLQDLRQAAEEFSTAVADSVSLVERVKLLQEELAAQIHEQTSRTLFTLTIVTVLALPINLIAGLFGMNVGGIPFGHARHGFFLIVATLTVTTTLLGYLAIRIRRD